MTYLMTKGSAQGPYFEEDEYWQEEWGHVYDTMLPHWEGYEIDPKYFPKSMYHSGGRRKYPPLLAHPDFWCAKEVIEVFEKYEPSRFRYNPVKVRKSKRSDEIVAKYHWMTICDPVDSLKPNHEDNNHIKKAHKRPAHMGEKYSVNRLSIEMDYEKGQLVQIFLDPEKNKDRHLWREERIGSAVFVSEEMREALLPFCQQKNIDFFKLA